MKILPFIHASFPVLLDDGTVVAIPVQTQPLSSGKGMSIRLGNTLMLIDESGRLEGYEQHVGAIEDPEKVPAIGKASSEAYHAGFNQPPPEPYYEADTPGGRRERAGWLPGASAAVPPRKPEQAVYQLGEPTKKN